MLKVRPLVESINKSGIDRGNLFITLSIYSDEVQNTNDIKLQLERFLNLIWSDYVDSIQFPIELIQKISLEKIKNFTKQLLQEGKTRFTSLTNANLELLKNIILFLGTNYLLTN